MTKHLEREVERLKKHLHNLTELVESQVRQAISIFSENQRIAFKSAVEIDQKIDRCEVELEEECLKLLALHQPVASDLRFIVAVLKINNDLERIGDHAINMVRSGERLRELGSQSYPEDLINMSQRAQLMLRQSLLCLFELDSQIALSVLQADDEVDRLNRALHLWVTTEAGKSPERAEVLLLILSVTKQLERIADLASNIAEDVIYLIDGEIVRHGKRLNRR